MARCKHIDENGVRCTKSSSYKDGNGKVIYCATHGKARNLERDKGRVCATEGCNIEPSWGEPDGMCTHCAKCGEALGLVPNKTRATCATEGCLSRPTWGSEWGITTHCSTCGEALGLMRSTGSKCATEGCFITPTWGSEWGITTHCSTCGEALGLMRSAGSKCETEGCFTVPTWGPGWGIVTHCEPCGRPLDLVRSKGPKCETEGCFITPSYGNEGEGVTRCYTHRDDGMKDILSRRCNICDKFRGEKREISEGKYIFSCYVCLVEKFPDSKIARRVKTKENAMVNRIIRDFKEYKPILDKNIPYDGRRFRPDVLIKLESHNIIIENDENQHSRYPKKCELGRIENLFMGLGCNKLVFLRFNPDSYIDIDGKKHSSCFVGNSCNLKARSYEKRYGKLESLIKQYIDNIPDEEYQQINLFYNEIESPEDLECCDY